MMCRRYLLAVLGVFVVLAISCRAEGENGDSAGEVKRLISYKDILGTSKTIALKSFEIACGYGVVAKDWSIELFGLIKEAKIWSKVIAFTDDMRQSGTEIMKGLQKVVEIRLGKMVEVSNAKISPKTLVIFSKLVTLGISISISLTLISLAIYVIKTIVRVQHDIKTFVAVACMLTDAFILGLFVAVRLFLKDAEFQVEPKVMYYTAGFVVLLHFVYFIVNNHKFLALVQLGSVSYVALSLVLAVAPAEDLPTWPLKIFDLYEYPKELQTPNQKLLLTIMCIAVSLFVLSAQPTKRHLRTRTPSQSSKRPHKKPADNPDVDPKPRHKRRADRRQSREKHEVKPMTGLPKAKPPRQARTSINQPRR